MRTIERTGQFKRDFKREQRGRYAAQLTSLLPEVIGRLAQDEELPARFKDHNLSGDWSDHRECHIKPDLLLIYRKPDEHVLQLVRMGSHAELFG
jgi:mRNA interferase YafQ